MPYIEPEKRTLINTHLDQVLWELNTEGDFNYAITYLIHQYVLDRDLRYTTLNNAVGILDCAKDEFKRQVLHKYENLKKEENGPVSELDAKMGVST